MGPTGSRLRGLISGKRCEEESVSPTPHASCVKEAIDRCKTMLQVLTRRAAGGRFKFSRFVLSIVLLLLMSTPAESTCIDDALAQVDRDMLIMASTSAYRLLDDWRTVVFWLPLSRVTICDELGNVGDELAIYYEIRNQDQNQMVRAIRER